MISLTGLRDMSQMDWSDQSRKSRGAFGRHYVYYFSLQPQVVPNQDQRIIHHEAFENGNQITTLRETVEKC